MPGNPPLDGIIKQAIHTVTVILVILGGIDPALGCDRVCPAGAILIAECLYIIAQLTKGSGSGGPGQPGTHYNNGIFTFIGRIDQLEIEFML